jgi:hypothetical protein
MSSDPTKPESPRAEDVNGAPAEQPEAYVIPRELAQATLNYLAAQPYREVFPLVQAFEALEPLPSADGGV